MSPIKSIFFTPSLKKVLNTETHTRPSIKKGSDQLKWHCSHYLSIPLHTISWPEPFSKHGLYILSKNRKSVKLYNTRPTKKSMLCFYTEGWPFLLTIAHFSILSGLKNTDKFLFVQNFFSLKLYKESKAFSKSKRRTPVFGTFQIKKSGKLVLERSLCKVDNLNLLVIEQTIWFLMQEINILKHKSKKNNA